MRFEGDPYPVKVFANNRLVSSSGGRTTLPAGSVRIRVVSEATFLSKDFGIIELAPNARRLLQLPATAGVTLDVRNAPYDQLQILLDGSAVAGPYPAQIRQLALGAHKVIYRWSDGAHQPISSNIQLADGQIFRVMAEGKNDTVTVNKVR